MSLTYGQAREAIAELVAEGIRKGHVRIAELTDAGIQLEITELGHRALDEYFRTRRWRVSVIAD